MFKKILIPIDGSDAAQKAVMVAKNIAEKYGSQEVILLHVIAMPFIPMEEHAPSADILEMPNPDEFELFKNAKEVFKDTGITINIQLERGFVSSCIVSTATEEQADLIVIGSRGLSGLKSFFLGSVSKQVVDDAPCTTIVVK